MLLRLGDTPGLTPTQNIWQNYSSVYFNDCIYGYKERELTYLLTHSTVQSPFWAANWLAASQEITHISRNPKVHYRTHKRPPPVSILGQPNPVHIPTSHLLEIHPNIIRTSTPRSPQWSLSLRLPHQEPIPPPSLHPYAPHREKNTESIMWMADEKKASCLSINS